MSLQCDFFEGVETFTIKQPCIEELMEEIKDVRAMSHNVRKGIFARHNEVVKEMSSYYIELHNKINKLEEEIIKLKEST
jgi:Na+/phosphate symporter